MTQPPTTPDSNRDADMSREEKKTTAPRWVKVFWIIGAGVVLLFIILMLMGGHGPGRHVHGASKATSPLGVIAQDVQQA